jgi:DNA-directed RNA polymerase subunit RPC12/RpoP
MEKLTTACKYCGKIIEFTEDDTEQDWDYFDTEDLVEYTLVEKYIICPHCGEKIIIDKWVE